MTHEITLSTVLEHIQTMKYDLQTRITRLDTKVTNLTIEMHQGFENARRHRQTLQEDLDATIRMQGKHQTAITRLTKKSR